MERGFTRAVLFVAGLRLVYGMAGLALSALDAGVGEFGRALPLLLILAYAGAAVALLTDRRSESRTRALGVAYLVTASQFALPLAELYPAFRASPLTRWLETVAVGHFVPYFLWRFFLDFPDSAHGPDRWARWARAATVTSLALGVIVTLLAVSRLAAPSPWVEAPLTWGWALLALTLLPALPLAWWRSSAATRQDQRRLKLFISGLGLGFGPLFVQLLLEGLFPAYDAWTSRSDVLPWARGVLQFLLLSVPFTTGYAVLVQRVLPVQVAMRRAAQYALARSTLLAVGSVPLLLLVAEVLLRREDRVADLATSPIVVGSALATAASALLLASRGGALAALDARFFRSQVEAERVLTRVVQSAARATDPNSLGQVLAGGLDGALHPESFALLVEPRPGDSLRAVCGEAPDLRTASTLAGLLSGESEPLDVDLERTGSPLRRLPEDERSWLISSGFSLLVPLLSTGGGLLGAIGLGPKKSDLPYDRNDRELLRAVAASTALVLENQAIRNTPQHARGTSPAVSEIEAPADECVACGEVQTVSTPECLACGAATRAALLPRDLRGKFELERRLGAGGMGVVYLARDRDLGRAVALKTLPRTSEEAVRRLRREARAAAAVSHPHLATVFGLESWSGIPFVVIEYLPGGSLADRLARTGPLPVGEWLALARALASALATAHAAGILHRDIKPSNVAFTAAGQAKLLDFGLARILGLPDSGAVPGPLGAATADTRSLAHGPLTESGVVLGTPAYMSPEAARGAPPSPALDLWSLAVLLYEAASGANPFARPTLRETLEAIGWERVPPLALVRPGFPHELSCLLAEALDPSAAARPGSASSFLVRLDTPGLAGPVPPA